MEFVIHDRAKNTVELRRNNSLVISMTCEALKDVYGLEVGKSTLTEMKKALKEELRRVWE